MIAKIYDRYPMFRYPVVLLVIILSPLFLILEGCAAIPYAAPILGSLFGGKPIINVERNDTTTIYNGCPCGPGQKCGPDCK